VGGQAVSSALAGGTACPACRTAFSAGTYPWRRSPIGKQVRGGALWPCWLTPAVALTYWAATAAFGPAASWVGEEDSARRMISVTVSRGSAVESMLRW
jgi:hypothetical protein